VELDSINERVFVDRPGVRGALAQRLAVGLAGSSDVRPGDCRERDKLDCIDLDLTEADRVAAALPDPWPLPQPDRERDVSRQDVTTQLAAELHTRKLARRRDRGDRTVAEERSRAMARGKAKGIVDPDVHRHRIVSRSARWDAAALGAFVGLWAAPPPRS
jgi:hypothetical protein